MTVVEISRSTIPEERSSTRVPEEPISFPDLKPLTLKLLEPEENNSPPVILKLKASISGEALSSDDGMEQKLLRQKITLQTFAGIIYKKIGKSLIKLLEENPDLQTELGIKLVKGQSINLNDLLDKVQKQFAVEDQTVAEKEEFVWIEREQKPTTKELEEMFEQICVMLEQFDVKIKHREICPEIVATPFIDEVQKAIEDYVESQWDLKKTCKKTFETLGPIWVVVKLFNKLNNYGVFSMIANTAAIALSILIV
jgi:hypothetical protein